MRLFLLVILISAIVTHIVAHEIHNHEGKIIHRCVHNEHSKETPEKYHTNHLKYVNHPMAGIQYPYKARRSTPVVKNIRLNFTTSQFESTSEITEAQKTLLKEKILPAAAKKLSEMLKIVPVSGNLIISPSCVVGQYWADGIHCKQLLAGSFNPTCGAFYNIPSEHKGTGVTCPIENDLTSCTNTSSSEGIPNSDMMIYVSAARVNPQQSTQSCGPTTATLAYASHCQRDQYDRPITGYINFCPSKLSTNTENLITIAVHEITHALGFSQGSYNFFRYKNGTPRVSRNEFTQNPQASVDEAVVKSYAERGYNSLKIVTENALQKARDHFGCSTLNGVELEEGSGSGTAGSHWDMRIFYGDYMNGALTPFPVHSAITLGLLEDSGWYYPDYSKADWLSWGYKKSCDFALNKCVSNGVSSFKKHFCTVHQEKGCSQDHLSAGLCVVSKYVNNLATQYQYFSDPKQGGAEEMEFCPIFNRHSIQNADQTIRGSNCFDPNNKPPSGENTAGEAYCPQCRCLQSTLKVRPSNIFGFITGGITPDESRGRCYYTKCTGSGSSLRATIRLGNDEIICFKTDSGSFKSSTGFVGSIQCPDVENLCNSLSLTIDDGEPEKWIASANSRKVSVAFILSFISVIMLCTLQL